MFKRLFLTLILALPLAPAKAMAGDPIYRNSEADVARVFGVSQGTARQIRAHNVDELLGWAMMLMASRCQCPASTLIERRKTMSWGEVAKSTGWEWGKLMDEVLARSQRAQLRPSPPEEEQRHRSAANDPTKISPWHRKPQ